MNFLLVVMLGVFPVDNTHIWNFESKADCTKAIEVVIYTLSAPVKAFCYDMTQERVIAMQSHEGGSWKLR